MEWYRKRTLGGVLDEAAARWGRREALVFESRRWTYAELNAGLIPTCRGPYTPCCAPATPRVPRPHPLRADA